MEHPTASNAQCNILLDPFISYGENGVLSIRSLVTKSLDFYSIMFYCIVITMLSMPGILCPRMGG